jgi:hypothetical protein
MREVHVTMTAGLTPREAALHDALIRLATECWRLLRTVQRTQQTLDADQQRRIGSRVAFVERAMSEELAAFGIKLVEFNGQQYGPELPATAVNADEFAATDTLVVDQTIEPAVLGPDGLMKSGTVTLRRGVP